MVDLDTTENTTEDTTEDNTKLLKALQSERQKNAELAKKVKRIDSLDLNKYEELLEAEKSREERELESAKAFEELKKRWGQKEADYKVKIEETERKLKVKDTFHSLEKEFYKAGGLSDVDDEGVSAFDLVYEQAVKYLSPDGGLVNPKTGENLINDNGQDFTIGDLMGKLRNGRVTSALFKAPEAAKGGGGMVGSNNRPTGVKKISRTDLNALSKPGVLEGIANGSIDIV